MNNNNLPCREAGDSAPIHSAPASPGLPDSREELLRAVRDRNPELQPEDAFVVPAFFARQKEWLQNPDRLESAVYNYPLLLRLRGPLNERALQQSLQEIVRRQAVFRSVFRVMDGRLVQIVVAPPEFSLPVTHLGGPPEDGERRLREAARAEAMRPFDLARDALLRGRLLRLRTDDHVLQLTTHTLVYDDWSTGVLINELSELYAALAAGTIPLQRALPFQFGDFARWQRQRLQGPELEAHLDFCRPQLDSATAFAHLPADFARPARNGHTGAKETAILPAAQAEALKELSRQERVSLFMVLLAGFKCLLHRVSGHEEIGVASCAANRPLEEVEGLIGRFGNTMLLRTSLAGNPTFGELFKRVQEVTLKALSHLELPFGLLLETMAGEAAGNRSRPFQVMFILQNAPKESWQLPGLSAEWAPLETGTSKLDLIVWLKIEPRLEITLEYNTQLFASASMRALLADYQAILETMAQDPKARVNTLRLSPRPEPAGAQPAPGTAGAMDQAGVTARLIEIWQSAFAPRPIDVTQDFFELGGDSLLAVRMFAQINKTFQRAMPLSVLFEAPTIRQLAQILCGQTPGASSSLVSIQPQGARPPLFCVHGSGGEPNYGWELSRRLGPDQPLYGIRSPGLCGQPLQRTIPEMAAHYAKLIRAAQPAGPYYLGGFCFGGLVAYEMARLLTAQGQDVAFLAIFDTPAPGTLRLIDELRGRIRHAWWRFRVSGLLPSVRLLGRKSAQLPRLARELAQAALGGVLPKSSPSSAQSLSRELLRISDANVAAAKAYHPGPYAGPITLFSTQEGRAYFGRDLPARWLPFAAGGVEHHDAAGGHLSQFDAAFVTTLAEKLKQGLERARNPKRTSPAWRPQGLDQETPAPEHSQTPGKITLLPRLPPP